MFNSYGKIPYLITGILTVLILTSQNETIKTQPNNKTVITQTISENSITPIQEDIHDRYDSPPITPSTIHIFKNDRVTAWAPKYSYGIFDTTELDPIPREELWEDYWNHIPLPYSTWTYRPSSKGYGPTCGGVNTHNIFIVNDAAKQYGWDKGQNWNALVYIINHEGAWCETAQNPTSTAYGIGQFLDSTWQLVGIEKTSDPYLQAEAIMKYISLARYGTPLNAYYVKVKTGIY